MCKVNVAVSDDTDGFHYERIICPECDKVETGKVEHTDPWWSYVHTCSCCGYVIMESEWEKFYKD